MSIQNDGTGYKIVKRNYNRRQSNLGRRIHCCGSHRKQTVLTKQTGIVEYCLGLVVMPVSVDNNFDVSQSGAFTADLSTVHTTYLSKLDTDV